MAIRKAAHRRRRSTPAERTAEALEHIRHILHKWSERQETVTFTQEELDELYRAAGSSTTASDALQERLRKAIGKL